MKLEARPFMQVSIGVGALLIGIAAVLFAWASTFHYQDLGEDEKFGGTWVMRLNGLTGAVTMCSNRYGCSDAAGAQPVGNASAPP